MSEIEETDENIINETKEVVEMTKESSNGHPIEPIKVSAAQQLISEDDSNIFPDAARDVRIAIRKNRIEAARLARSKPKEATEETNRRAKRVEVEEKNTGRATSQVNLSKKRLQSNRENGSNIVSNIKAGVTARESLRRQDENRKVLIWKQKETTHETNSSIISEKIDIEWKRLQGTKGPYELLKLLEDQKLACQNMLQVKDNLIEEYALELKAKDDEYVRELKRQSEEIDKLLDRMETQYKKYQVSLVEEIEQIENAFVDERTELIKANNKDIDSCFSNRRNNEIKYMEEKSFRIEDYVNQLEQLRINDSEEYNLVKIKLETDVQVLEQQLQQMRVTYLLNIEKLEYNYQVLKKREEENGTILGAQKRKINRLADHLNMLRIKLAKQEKVFQQENQSLTDDYKNLTEQYKELQKKFKHFQLADSKRFKEIWKMNEDNAKEMMRKVLQADRIIHEQQLGMEWKPPIEDLFKNVDPLFFQKKNNHKTKISDAEQALENQIEERIEPNYQDQIKESLASKFQSSKKNSKTMKMTLELLCNEAGFLVEDKLQKLLEPLQRDEQSLMRLDSIFKALGVESVDDIERLSSFFVQDAISDQDSQKSKSELIIEDNAVLIHPNDVVTAIRRFVDSSRHSNFENEDTTEMEEQFKEEQVITRTETKNQKAELQKQYWERMTTVLDENTFRTWNAVYYGMEKYHQELTERYNLSLENKSLARQNAELKNLLRQYMEARVNDELQIPPSQIMLAQAGMLTE